MVVVPARKDVCIRGLALVWQTNAIIDYISPSKELRLSEANVPSERKDNTFLCLWTKSLPATQREEDEEKGEEVAILAVKVADKVAD